MSQNLSKVQKLVPKPVDEKGKRLGLPVCQMTRVGTFSNVLPIGFDNSFRGNFSATLFLSQFQRGPLCMNAGRVARAKIFSFPRAKCDSKPLLLQKWEALIHCHHRITAGRAHRQYFGTDDTLVSRFFLSCLSKPTCYNAYDSLPAKRYRQCNHRNSLVHRFMIFLYIKSS